MSKRPFCVALGLLLVLPVLQAQPPSMNISGAGARAMGMGGAFTAIADDATAVYYNPAGLAQLKRPEVTLVGYYAMNGTDTELTGVGWGESASIDSNNFKVNFGSLVFPLNPGGHNLVLAGSSHMMIDMYRGEALTIPDTKDEKYGKGYGTYSYEDNQEGGIYAYSFFSAYEVNKYLLVGAGLGWLSGGFDQTDIEVFTSDESSDDWKETEQQNLDFSGGPMITVGTLLKLTPKIKLGAVVRTASVLEFDGGWKQEGSYSWGSGPTTDEEKFAGELDMPLMFSAGTSYRPYDALTVACDYQAFQWSECEMRDEDGDADSDQRYADSGQVHVGVEYLAPILSSYPTPFRLGFYTYPTVLPTRLQQEIIDQRVDDAGDPDPKPEALLAWDQYTRNFFTGGFGIIMADAVLDFTLEYSALSDEAKLPDEGDFYTQSNENTLIKFYLSGIYKF